MSSIDGDAPALTRGTCAECGGRFIDGLECREMFEALLAWEWQNPALGAVHFLTVSSYLLQHPVSLTGEAASGLLTAFTQILSGEMTITQVRAQATRAYDAASRVRRPAHELRPQFRGWSMTVADVYAGGQACAAEGVKAWAQIIRTESAEGATGAVSEPR